MAIEPLTPERRRRQTRDHLLQAAAQVFAERGFHGASLDEVAAVAGFTKGAVYSNFKSKDDLFVALLESRYQQQMQALRATLEASEGSPEAHLADFAGLVREQFEAGDAWGALYEEFYIYALRNPAARATLAEFDRTDVASIAEIIDAERRRLGIATAEPGEHEARITVALFRGLSLMRLIDAEAIDQALIESALTFLVRAMMSAPEASGPLQERATSPASRRASRTAPTAKRPRKYER